METISPFKNFERNPNLPLTAFFKNFEPKDEFIENSLLFFKELGKEVPITPSSMKEVQLDYRINLLFSILENGQQCHETCMKYAFDYPHLEQYFGFADQYYFIEGEYHQTFCHSFLISKEDGKLYDPQIEYIYLESFPHSVKNYFGVRLPTEITRELLVMSEGTGLNIGGFIRHYILTSRENTEKFMNTLKSYKQ